MVLRRIKDLVRSKFNVSIAEVGENDSWQRAVLGLTLVATTGGSPSRRWTRCCASCAATSEVVERGAASCRSFGDELAGPDFKHWEG